MSRGGIHANESKKRACTACGGPLEDTWCHARTRCWRIRLVPRIGPACVCRKVSQDPPDKEPTRGLVIPWRSRPSACWWVPVFGVRGSGRPLPHFDRRLSAQARPPGRATSALSHVAFHCRPKRYWAHSKPASPDFKSDIRPYPRRYGC